MPKPYMTKSMIRALYSLSDDWQTSKQILGEPLPLWACVRRGFAEFRVVTAQNGLILTRQQIHTHYGVKKSRRCYQWRLTEPYRTKPKQRKEKLSYLMLEALVHLDVVWEQAKALKVSGATIMALHDRGYLEMKDSEEGVMVRRAKKYRMLRGG